MAVDLVEVRSLAAAVLNVSQTTYGTISHPLFTQDEFDEAAEAADQSIIAAILDTDNHRYKGQYYELQNIPADGLVKGPIGATVIDGNFGTDVPPSKLKAFAQNILNLTTIAGRAYQHIQGNIVKFVGGTTGQVQTRKALVSNDLRAPNEYKYGVVCGALAIVFAKQGTNIAAATHFGGLWKATLDMIRGGATTIPAPAPYGQKA